MMEILRGWKQIAESLNLTPRTAQRWEQLGLPVRRVSNSRRSPIIAFSDEIESWVQRKATRLNKDSLSANRAVFKATRRKPRRLAQQLKQAGLELQEQIGALRNQLAVDQSSSASRPSKLPNMNTDFRKPPERTSARPKLAGC